MTAPHLTIICRENVLTGGFGRHKQDPSPFVWQLREFQDAGDMIVIALEDNCGGYKNRSHFTEMRLGDDILQPKDIDGYRSFAAGVWDVFTKKRNVLRKNILLVTSDPNEEYAARLCGVQSVLAKNFPRDAEVLKNKRNEMRGSQT